MSFSNSTYREDETVATLEHMQEKESPSPHHLDEVLRHVKFLPLHISVLAHHFVAVESPENAAVVRRLVPRHHQEVVRHLPSAFSDPEALQKKIQHRCVVAFDIGFVHYCDYYSLVGH